MTGARAADTNPYPGLRPFDEREEHLFFGREHQIDRMVDLLARRRFLAVVGGSGSGKSSLVNCGLQPALRRGLMARAGTAWRMLRFRPGLRPIEALAQALAGSLARPGNEVSASLAAADLSQAEVIATQLRLSRLGLVEVAEQAGIAPGTNLLVVADQFEELFRYNALAEQGEAQALVNLLLACSAQEPCPIFVVLTMRSDFLGDCAQFPGLPEAITSALHLVPRLSREERRQAIALPALVSGTTVDPVLLSQLVNDVGDDPDQLSILQHALRRTWNHWHQRGGQGPITLADYEAVGTMASALERHAEQALAELAEGERNVGASGDQTDSLALAGRLFRALTDKASDPRGIRRPTTLADLQAICGGDPGAVERQVNHFRQADRAFLMPPEADLLRADSVVDISHESLMRVWRRLDHWADQEATAAALFQRLADAAGRHGLGQASLWRDPELQLALDWRQLEQPTEAWAHRYASNHHQALAFLEASREARETERRQLEWRRQRALLGLAGFSLLTCVVGGVSWWQWQLTRISRARAYGATAAASLERRPLQSMLYGLAALERLGQEPAEALGVAYTLAQASLRNWEHEHWEINPRGTGRQAITALLALRDGTAITAAGCGPGPTEGLSCLQRWRGSTPVGNSIPTDQEEVTALLELGDGQLVAGGSDGRLGLWSLGSPSLSISEPLAAGDASSPIHSLVELRDGEIVSGDNKGTLRRWRRAGQGGITRLKEIAAPIRTGVSGLVLAALPDGGLVSGGAEPTQHREGAGVQLWRQGRPVGVALRTGQTVVKQLLVWGNQVLSVGSEGSVQWLSPNGGTSQALALAGRNSRPDVDHLLVVGNGRALLTVHGDGDLRLWRRADGPDGVGRLELLAIGQADSDDLQQLVALNGGSLLAADGNHKLHRLQPPDPDSAESERTGFISSGHRGVNSLLAGPGALLISGGVDDGRLCMWTASQQLKPLTIRAGGRGSCLTGNLGTRRSDQDAGAVVLTPLPGGAMLSATNISRNTESPTPQAAVVIQRWQLGSAASTTSWRLEPLPLPQPWSSVQDLLAVGKGEILGLGAVAAHPDQTGLWRWDPQHKAAGAVQLELMDRRNQRLGRPGWWRAVTLPGGEVVSAASVGGTLQRWRPQGSTSLRETDSIDTGLDGIAALTLLPGGRHLVIAGGLQSGDVATVQVFDLRNKVWVGQPIPVPRPFGLARGTVGATALAVLPENGLAIGTNRGDLLTIQPSRIRERACRQLATLLRSDTLLQQGRSGTPPGVSRYARKTCRV